MSKLNTRLISATAQKWVKRGVAFVVTLGAVAGAVTALWPEADPPDAVDRAELSVTVRSRVPLTQYARLASAQPQGFRLQPTDDTVIDPPEEPPAEPTEVPTEEPTDMQTEEIPTDVPPSDFDQSPTTSTSPEASAEGAKAFNVPNELVDKATNVTCRQLTFAAGKCRSVVKPMARGFVTDDSGKPVDPEVAARHVLEVLDDSQKTAKQEPLGAIVVVKADLIGLRDRPVLLTWAMWHKDGGDRLHENWLDERLAYQLRPHTDNESAVARLWIPLPKIPGPYLVGVTATVDGAQLTTNEAEFG